MVKWSELLTEHKEEIMEKIKEAEKFAYLHTSARYCVQLCDDGDVYIFEDIAGGNIFPTAQWEGHEIKVHESCYQYFDILDTFYHSDTSVEDLAEVAERNGAKDCLQAFINYLAEYGDEAEEIRENINELYPVFVDFLDENCPEAAWGCRDEAVDWEVDEWMSYYEEKIDEMIAEYEARENWEAF